jgi:hypothetical protein
MNVVAELTLEAILPTAHRSLQQYGTVLRAAFEDHPPAFTQSWYGKKYRHYAIDPLWLCQSLIDNSRKEGEGATKLWKLAASTEDALRSEAVRLHAVDEARHARLYLGMLRTAFPESVDESSMQTLYAETPPFSAAHYPERLATLSDLTVLDHLIQMNVGEIRTRVHQLLLMPVINAHCPSVKQQKLRGVLESILSDETKHIRYTAEIIEAATDTHKSYIRDLLYYRLQEFNQMTLDEVGGESFDDE